MVERKNIPMAMGLFAMLVLFIASSSFVHASDEADDAIFYESFDEDFDSRWIVSEKEEYN
ncbi:calnexin, partial [Trifolium pratense]